MSIPERLLRIARRRMLERLGLVQGAAFRHDPARDELEAYLRDPAPPARATAGANRSASDSPRAAAPPESAAPHPYQREYRLLGAPVGADLPTVQQCWRHLVREIHPDRFQNDPEAQRAAGDRLRRACAAYERLKAYLAG